MASSRSGAKQRQAGFAGNAAPALLLAWEEGCEASPGERGLLLLRLAAPALPDDYCLAALSVGERDGLLLDLFERLFGRYAPALADCPTCSETIEFDVPLDAIRVTPPPGRPESFTLVQDGHEVAYRLPRAGDLAALGARGGLESQDAARVLVSQCVLAPAALNDGVDEALEAAISAAVVVADPQALVTLDLNCPSCAARWQAPFDILEFLWCRVDWFVRGLLREVHVLASHYGWSEHDIVAMTAARRRHYIEMIET
jgi:hypothetical protein